MLPNSDFCSPGSDVCCDRLYSIGETILTVAVTAVNNPDCVSSDACHPNVDGMVIVGRPIGYPQFDVVMASMMRLSPRRNPEARGHTPPPYTFDSTWLVRLVETGWVTFQDGGNDEVVVPEPHAVTTMSLHAYSHAEQMYRALADAVSRNVIGDCGDGSCQASIGELLPVDPQGHTVGWETTLTIPVNLSQPCTPLP